MFIPSDADYQSVEEIRNLVAQARMGHVNFVRVVAHDNLEARWIKSQLTHLELHYVVFTWLAMTHSRDASFATHRLRRHLQE